MPSTIIDSIMNLVPAQVTSALAAKLGAPTDAIQSGVGTSAAALLSALADRSGDAGLMQRLFQHANTMDTSGLISHLTDLTSSATLPVAGEEPHTTMLSHLFGTQQAAVEGAVAKAAGLSSTAGPLLMGVAGPVTFAFLSKMVTEGGLSASTLGTFLTAEASQIKGLLPAGLGDLFTRHIPGVSVPGVTVPGVSVPKVSVPAPVRTAYVEPVKKGFNWLYLLLTLAIVALIAWLLAHGCNKPAPLPTVSVTAPSEPVGPLGEFIDRKLADGTVLHIPRLGIENRLIDFIESSSPVDKTTWFDFDRLTFDTGKSTLQPASEEQLKNITAILKAYPKVNAKIGGYTDNTGNAAANLTLSNDRAVHVMESLVTDGVGKERLEAKGYGEDHPVADNATEEGRQKNRRISLLVTQK